MASVFLAIEASATGLYPQLSLSIANFRCDSGMPSSIALSDPAAAISLGLRRLRVSHASEIVPEINASLEQVRHKRSSYAFKKAIGRLDEIATSGVSVRTSSIALALQFILRKKTPTRRAISGKRRPKLVSIERYLQDIERAYDAIVLARERGLEHARAILGPVDPVLRRVLFILGEVLDPEDFPDELVDSLATKSLFLARPFDLLHPAAYARYYNLHEPPPDPWMDLAASARRVLAGLLYYSGRRAVCVSLLTLGDILVARIGDKIDIRIPYTKNSREADFRAPLMALWPAEELDHLSAFAAEVRRRKLPRSSQLMVVARLGDGEWREEPYTKDTTDVAQARLASGLVPGRRVSTHLGRINWASWFSARVWCAHYPWLLRHPILRDVRLHPWFRPEALSRLRCHLQSSPNGRLEILRRLMGLGNPTQYIERYNRGWPLEVDLWAEIRQHNEARIDRLDAYWSRFGSL